MVSVIQRYRPTWYTVHQKHKPIYDVHQKYRSTWYLCLNRGFILIVRSIANMICCLSEVSANVNANYRPTWYSISQKLRPMWFAIITIHYCVSCINHMYRSTVISIDHHSTLSVISLNHHSISHNDWPPFCSVSH